MFVYSSQEPSFSGPREFIRTLGDFLDNGVTNHACVYAWIV